ncbi:MAG: DNA-binding protein, partial [Halopseudomonas sp.]
VRERLGKGSVSTIHKALGEWWQTLGKRLQQGRDYPELPDVLSEAMISWWHNAVDRSRREFEGQHDQQLRQLKALKTSHRGEVEQVQNKLSETLDKLSQQVEQQQQLYQQLHEAGQDRLALEQRVLNAESEAAELKRESKVLASVIGRLEADSEQLRQQLKRQAEPSGKALQQLQQENVNLRALVADLDTKYSRAD